MDVRKFLEPDVRKLRIFVAIEAIMLLSLLAGVHMCHGRVYSGMSLCHIPFIIISFPFVGISALVLGALGGGYVLGLGVIVVVHFLYIYFLSCILSMFRKKPKTGKGKPKTNMNIMTLVAIALVLINSAGMMESYVFGSGYCCGNVARGFEKIKALDNTIRYTENSLGFTIMNGAGEKIRDVKISVNNTNCRNAEVSQTVISAGSTAEVSMECDRELLELIFRKVQWIRVGVNITYQLNSDASGKCVSDDGFITATMEPE